MSRAPGNVAEALTVTVSQPDAPKSLQMVTVVVKLKGACSLEGKL